MKYRIYFVTAMISLGFLEASCRDTEVLRKALQVHHIQGATYVGSETCATCHEKEAKEFKLASHQKISIPLEGVKVEGCEMCHGPGSLHVDAGGGKGVEISNPKKNPEVCFACHMEKKHEFRMPHHHPVLEGNISCSDCHDLHGPESRSWNSTSVEGINQVCFKCHQEQSGPFLFEHEAMREGCTSCHKVHGSVNDKMLINRGNRLCLRCHTQTNFPDVGRVAHNGFSADVILAGPCSRCHTNSNGGLLANHFLSMSERGPCFSGGCHTSVHGSNFDDHFRY